MMNYSYLENKKSDITLLLLHGWGVDSSYMDSLKEFLKDDYSILIVDLPGHGKSYLNKSYDIDEYINQIFYVVTKEKIKNLYGIGHSFGGKLLGFYSLRYPLKGGLLIAPSLIKPRFSIIKFLKVRMYKILKKMHFPIPSFLQGSYDFKKSSGLKRDTFLNVFNQYFTKQQMKKNRCKFIIMGFTDDKEVKVKRLKVLNKYLNKSQLFIYKGNHFSYFSYFKEIKILISNLTRRKG